MTSTPSKHDHGPSDLADLGYLERITDFEDAVDHGPMAGKEILVYAPGKTGTVSLYQGIRNYLSTAQGWTDAHHTMLHNHSNRHLVNVLRLDADAPSRAQLLDRVIVRDLIDYKAASGGRLLVVSSYREPLSRAFSSVFQQLEDAVRRGDLDPQTLTLARCKQLARQWLTATMEGFTHSLTEIEPDFFRSRTFDHSTRSCYVERHDCRILVLTLPHVQAWSAACERHLGWNGIQFGHQNNAEQKPLARLYRQLKAESWLPADLIRRLYYDSAETECLRWFFSKAEVDDLCSEALHRYAQAARRSASTWRTVLRPLGFQRIRRRPAVHATLLSLHSRAGSLPKTDRSHVIASVRLRNTGKETWYPKNFETGRVAIALCATADDGRPLGSSICDQIRPW